MNDSSSLQRAMFIATLLWALPFTAAWAQSVASDEVIVRMDNATAASLRSAQNAVNALGHQRLFQDDIWLLKLRPGFPLEEAIEILESLDVVSYAHPNVTFQLATEPDDPRFFLQWHLNQESDADIDAPEAWDLRTDASEVIVAMLDSGVNYNHQDLAGGFWRNPGEIPGNGIDDDANGYVDDVRGYDFANEDGDPMDDHGHGTITAGALGAVTDNGEGIAGVPWNVQIMPVKIFGENGHPNALSDIVLGIEYAMNNGAHLTSNSWGGYWPYDDVRAMEDAIHTAWETTGMLFVAAAGNGSSNNDIFPFYPASFNLPEVVSVASTGRTDERSSFSNYGLSSVDLAAPGEDIYSTLIGGTYGWGSGTSMACPLVAGALALLHAECPERDLLDIKSRLMSSVDPLPSLDGMVFSGGRLNLHRALVECECRVTFATGGVGVAGSGGFVPSLDGGEGPCKGGYTLHISDGLGDGLGLLWVGVGLSEVPAFGGTFYINLVGTTPILRIPIRLQGPPGVPGSGSLDLPGIDVAELAVTSLHMQTTLIDSKAIQGVSMSGWLEMRIR